MDFKRWWNNFNSQYKWVHMKLIIEIKHRYKECKEEWLNENCPQKRMNNREWSTMHNGIRESTGEKTVSSIWWVKSNEETVRIENVTKLESCKE